RPVRQPADDRGRRRGDAHDDPRDDRSDARPPRDVLLAVSALLHAGAGASGLPPDRRLPRGEAALRPARAPDEHVLRAVRVAGLVARWERGHPMAALPECGPIQPRRASIPSALVITKKTSVLSSTPLTRSEPGPDATIATSSTT